MIYEILTATLAVIALALAVTSLAQNNKKNRYMKKYIESMITIKLVSDRIDELEQQAALAKMTESDGFVKFLSDSREWAFSYIEDVQAALEEFSEKAGPEIKYLGSDDGLKSLPQRKAFLAILTAYEQLQKSLPEKIKDN